MHEQHVVVYSEPWSVSASKRERVNIWTIPFLPSDSRAASERLQTRQGGVRVS